MRTVTIDCYEKNLQYETRVYSNIGGREEQQDCAYLCQHSEDVFAVICDGMGGLNAGRQASRTVISCFQEQYSLWHQQSSQSIDQFYEAIVAEADSRVYFLKDQWNRRLNAGTTVASIYIKDYCMYWLSVGDSRMYVKRGNQVFLLTNDHNYFYELDTWLRTGQITKEQYEVEQHKGESLISYIGKGGVELYDLSKQPLALQADDLVLLMTDGVWKSLAVHPDFVHLLDENELVMIEHNIRSMVDSIPESARDNNTMVLIHIL